MEAGTRRLVAIMFSDIAGYTALMGEDEERAVRALERSRTTIRTQVGSVMCANAPVHHLNHTDDLVRVGHGIYRRA